MLENTAKSRSPQITKIVEWASSIVDVGYYVTSFEYHNKNSAVGILLFTLGVIGLVLSLIIPKFHNEVTESDPRKKKRKKKKNKIKDKSKLKEEPKDTPENQAAPKKKNEHIEKIKNS